MNETRNHNKGFLREKLGDYQVAPPEKVWVSISDQLGGGRSRRGMLILALAAAASLALAVTLGIYYFGPDLPEEYGVAESPNPSVLSPSVDSGEALPPSEEKTLETNARDFRSQDTQGLTAGFEDQEQETAVRQVMPKELVRDQVRALLQESVMDREQAPGPEQIATLEPEAAQEVPEDPDLTDSPEDPDLPDSHEEPVLQDAPVDINLLDALTQDGQDQDLNEAVPEFTDAQKRDPRWMVGAVLSPLYSFRDAEEQVMGGAGTHESGLLSYSSGIHVNYRGRSRLAFETGILFNKTGLNIGASGIQLFNQHSDYLLFGSGSERTNIKAVTNSVGNIISNSGEIYVNGYKLNAANAPEAVMDQNFNNLGTTATGIEQHLDYLELPFNLRYTVIDRSFELQLVGGVSTNFLVNNYVTMNTGAGSEEIGYLTNIRHVNYSGNAGLGMVYHVGRKLNLMLEPRFRYFLNSINDSSLPSTRPYSIGLYTSLNYTF